MPVPPSSPINWESFYRSYRKPGYVPGFEIIQKIGAGSFGVVFKARKESIAKDYAIKFLKVDDEAVRDAILAELDTVRFLAQIDHPNLVSIEDKGEVDGIPYIVMGFAGDETLRDRLDNGPLERDTALSLFVQIARGVEALHQHAMVHFDLKPANVFLRGDHVRIGDYGLSKLVTQSRNSLSFGRGTPYYMAPEVLQRKGDHRSDIYALGCLLYECLTGEVPFQGESEWQVLRQHETALPRLPESLAEPERSILARCLQKNPADRFSSVTELLDALLAPAPAAVAPPQEPQPTAGAIGAAPTTAPPPRSCWGRPTTEERQRRGPARYVMAGIAAALLIGLIFSARKAQHEERKQRAIAHALRAATVQAEMVPRIRTASLQDRLARSAESLLKSLAREVRNSEAPEFLREAMRDASRDVRRELSKRDVPGLLHALDRLEGVVKRVLNEVEDSLRDDRRSRSRSRSRSRATSRPSRSGGR